MEALAGLPPWACVPRVGGGGTRRSPPLSGPALEAGGGGRVGGRPREQGGRGVCGGECGGRGKW